MGTSPIVPTTVEGIKRLAKSYARRFGLPHHEALERAAGDAGFASYAIALRVIRAPASKSEAAAPSKYPARKKLLTLASKALEAGDYPSANDLARRVQKNNSRELAAYAIIAQTEMDNAERRWVLLKAERAAQKLITPVPINQPGYMLPQHFRHFAKNRALLARDYWRAGPGQNKHLAIDLCKEVLWRDVEDLNGLRFNYYGWCMELHAHTAVAGMLDIRGPQDLPSTDLQEIISLMQARGDQATAASLIALAAERV
jgi:hypothetical protein